MGWWFKGQGWGVLARNTTHGGPQLKCEPGTEEGEILGEEERRRVRARRDRGGGESEIEEEEEEEVEIRRRRETVGV